MALPILALRIVSTLIVSVILISCMGWQTDGHGDAGHKPSPRSSAVKETETGKSSTAASTEEEVDQLPSLSESGPDTEALRTGRRSTRSTSDGDKVTVSSAETAQRLAEPAAANRTHDGPVVTSGVHVNQSHDDSMSTSTSSPTSEPSFERRGVDSEAESVAENEDKPPLVGTKYGRVKGKHVFVNGDVVNVFMGLPFATAERWREPKPPAPWEGERDATEPGPACPQYRAFHNLQKVIRRKGKPLPTAEDCLFLNVYTPTRKNAPDFLPVMVWIHGGAFVEGTGSIYDGEVLAATGNIVVVTINYRLGVFGFFQLATGRTANFGLLDQVAALQWVKENIRWFGGDEGKVTIFGESAGGASVGWLLLSTKTTPGLFKRVIMQSGTPNSDWAWRSSERALADTERLAQSLHCDVGRDIESCLQQKDTDTLVDAHFDLVHRSVWKSAPAIELLDASPVIDGHFITDTPSNLLVNQAVLPPVEVMVGFTEHEMTFFHMFTTEQKAKAAAGFSREEFHKFVEERIMLSGPDPVISNSSSTCRKLSKEVISAVRKVVEYEYADIDELRGSGEAEKLRDLMFEMWSDAVFACPSVSLLDKLAKRKVHTFAYVYSHIDGRLPVWAKAGHTVELDYVFGMPLVNSRLSVYDPVKSSYHFSGREKVFCRTVVMFWSSFAATGKPTAMYNGQSTYEWPQFTRSAKSYLVLDTTLGIAQRYRRKQCLFWSQQLPRLLSVLSPAQETGRCKETNSYEVVTWLMFSCLAVFWLASFVGRMATL